MAGNTYHNLNASDTKTLGAQITSVIGASPSTWGATATQVTNLNTALTTLGTTITNVETTKVAAQTAIGAQTTAKDSVIDQIAVIAKQMYAKAGITNEQIQSTGLAVHDTEPSHITPQQPTLFGATPFADGQVAFKWNRNGNPYGVQFFIEASVDGGAWQTIFATKRKSVKLQGFAPGVPATFRVFAWNANESSAPSLTASIYEEAAPAGLQIAA